MAKRKSAGIVVTQKPKEKVKTTSDAVDSSKAAPVAQATQEAFRRDKKKRRKGAKDRVVASKEQAPDSDSEEGETCPTEMPAKTSGDASTVVDVTKSSRSLPSSPLIATPAGQPPVDALDWLLWPLDRASFFGNHWEKLPLHFRREQSSFYGDLFSKSVFDQHLKGSTPLAYGERINAMRFDSAAGRTVDLNKGGRGTLVSPKDITAHLAAGATVQLLNPQHLHTPAWRLVAGLERELGSLVGMSVYLTPKGGQGLPAHCDDTEVFILQLEGSSRWKCHEPPEKCEYPLAREPSCDFEEPLGRLLLDAVLQPGDLLYIPRGVANFGVAEKSSAFSQHITISTYQNTAWCHLLDKALSSAVARAAAECADFRAGLPVNYTNFIGNWHHSGSVESAASASAEKSDRRAFLHQFQGLTKRLMDFIDVDEASDELGIDFMTQRAPPCRQDSACSAAIDLETRMRFKDVGSLRPMLGNDPETNEPTVMLFHSVSNKRQEHMNRAVEEEEDVGCLHFEASVFLPAIRKLIAANREYVCCGDLPLKSDDDKVALVENLREAGLLETVAT